MGNSTKYREKSNTNKGQNVCQKVRFKTAFRSHNSSVDLRTLVTIAVLCKSDTVTYQMLFFVSTAKARVPERDVARYKPAIQPTTYSDAYAWKAVDGDTLIGGYSCNLAALHSWWALDLVERFLVSKVIVMTDDNGPAGNLSFYSCRVKLVISAMTKF